MTNNGSNENGSNEDEGTSSVERTSVCASADTQGNIMNVKGSSRDSCSSGSVSWNGNEKENQRLTKLSNRKETTEEEYNNDDNVEDYKLLTSSVVLLNPPDTKHLKVDPNTHLHDPEALTNK